jgi:hypothetical protein
MVLQRLRFSVLISLVGLTLTLDARTVEERPKVLVSVFNDAGVDDSIMLLAEKMASQIYAQAGLSIIWKNCLAQRELRREKCVQTVDSRHVVLHIEHQARTLGTDIYGVAFLGEDGSGVFCDVFYDPIAELHRRGRASEATILAIVAAHELGHLLLGSHAHSPIGIMRPQMRARDFWTPELGTTTFSREQTQKISARLVRINAESVSKSHGAGL